MRHPIYRNDNREYSGVYASSHLYFNRGAYCPICWFAKIAVARYSLSKSAITEANHEASAKPSTSVKKAGSYSALCDTPIRVSRRLLGRHQLHGVRRTSCRRPRRLDGHNRRSKVPDLSRRESINSGTCFLYIWAMQTGTHGRTALSGCRSRGPCSRRLKEDLVGLRLGLLSRGWLGAI